MASAVTIQELFSKAAIESYDHDPGATTAVVTSPDGGTTPRWVPMRDYGAFAVQARPTVVATDAAGSDPTVVVAHAASATTSLGHYLSLECLAEQVSEVGSAAGLSLTHVAARLTMAAATDEANVTYIRHRAKAARAGLTVSATA